MESPGFLAKHYMDAFMKCHSNDMFVMAFVDKRNTNFNSTDIESAGFEKALDDFLLGAGLNVAEAVTDTYSVVARLMSKFHKYFVASAVN